MEKLPYTIEEVVDKEHNFIVKVRFPDGSVRNYRYQYGNDWFKTIKYELNDEIYEEKKWMRDLRRSLQRLEDSKKKKETEKEKVDALKENIEGTKLEIDRA